MDYRELSEAIVANDRARFVATVELHPQEDRHFASGCRACRRPASAGAPCPGCGKSVARGVSDRVAALADRGEDDAVRRAERHHRLVPLAALIAEARGVQSDADSVRKEYMSLTADVGAELDILLMWEERRLRDKLPSRLADAVLSARRGDVTIEPGYDGCAGRVKVNLPPPPPSPQLNLI
jgi:PHP family Zn ribbon phosphoesterase